MYGLLELSDVISRSGDVNGELNGISHIRASPEIANRLGEENRVGIVNLFIVITQEDRRKNVHLLNDHVDTVDNTAVTNVEGMHDEDEDDGLEHGLACVLEHETNQEKLRSDHEDHLGGGQAHHQQ